MLTTLSSYGKIPIEKQGELVRQAKPDSERDRPVTARELEVILREIRRWMREGAQVN
jgi:hypothetical protein